MNTSPEKKIEKVLNFIKNAKVDEWALQLKNKYLDEALNHLGRYCRSFKKKRATERAGSFLIQREV